jgi:hypothetical protein
MKLWLSLLLPAAFFISACGDEEPPASVRHHAARYPSETDTENPPTQQPFNPNAGPPESATATETSAPPAPTGGGTKPAKGDFPYGVPIPDKPGFCKSPYAPDQGIVDIRGFSPGQEVKDPYTGKTFLVP